ncbi:thioesterase domain-containing protein [Streptomyces sp. NBC_01298]|uniref:thioesterase domain-containing protein n=1 Tax=Streptomyces sp. NBC_01298 TaxID=2903817 RepID=UPI002E12BD02|nr:thioesterase domain-containing protein [Streptomyces sp. NBC_01298]
MTSAFRPRSGVEAELGEIWSELLGHSDFGVHDSFFRVGGTSFAAIRLLARLNSAFGYDIPLAELVRSPTVADLAMLLRGSATPGPAVLVPIDATGDRPPLFCLHPIGGNVSRYVALAQALGDEQPVYGLQSIGLGDGSSAVSDIEEMAASYVEEIIRLRPEGPYQLLGYSMGGMLAHTCARMLFERTGEQPFLAVVDTDVRNLARLDPWDEVVRIVLKADRSDVDGSVLRGADRDTAVRTLHGLCVERNILSAGFPVERLGDIFDTIWANLEAVQSFSPVPYPGEMVLFCCGEDSDLGWTPYAGTIRTHVLEGGHFGVMELEGAAALAAALRGLLAGRE